MSGTNRTLKINPQLFLINGKSKKEKRTRTVKTRDKPAINEENSLKSKQIQKALINKVKNYQKNKEVEATNAEKNSNKPEMNEIFEKNKFESVNFEREFEKSLNFLSELSVKNKYRKRNKHTIKNKPNTVEINLELPSNLEKTNPAPHVGYSSLKNGSRPTYRDFNKTQKNQLSYKPSVKIVLENNRYDRTDSNEVEIIPTTNNKSDTVIETHQAVSYEPNDKVLPREIARDLENDELKINKPNKNIEFSRDIVVMNDIEIAEQPNNSIAEVPKQPEPTVDTIALTPIPIKHIPKINKLTTTSTYKLGKQKNKNKVGILIKNNQTQKNIKREITGLKQKSIPEIKNYLRGKNLIKSGTEAPNDVLRKLYEDSLLSGEVNNINTNNLVFNYLNT
tara:strand:+ start:3801 stop:4979 length:1179 start_codon:yes stop_codon:yes gene_type:complete